MQPKLPRVAFIPLVDIKRARPPGAREVVYVRVPNRPSAAPIVVGLLVLFLAVLAAVWGLQPR